jgi:hypothetical protein
VRTLNVESRALKREEMPDDLVGALIFLASHDSDFTIIAQAMQAFLLASATAASFLGLRASSANSHGAGRPGLAYLTIAIAAFGTNVEFGQECNAIVCLTRDIEAAVPTSDPAIARHIQQYLDTVAPRLNATMRDSARECIYL